MYSAFIWIALLIAFIILESCTYQLICVWFAAGSAIAAICAGVGLGVMWQVVAFLVVSVICLIVLRPLSLKLIKKDKFSSNAEGLIGKKVTLITDSDDVSYSGRATIGGTEWAVRCDEGQKIQAGSVAYIKEIEGVKLIVSNVKE